MDWLEKTRCNRDECLRKFKADDGEISSWCGVIGDEVKDIKINSKECPLRCTKYFCYQTRKIVKKHKHVYWVDKDKFDDNYRKLYNIPKDIKFSGLSKDGNVKGKKEWDFSCKHENTSNIVCPHCDYEIEDWYEYVNDGDTDIDIECHNCNEEFNVQVEYSVSFTTSVKKDDKE